MYRGSEVSNSDVHAAAKDDVCGCALRCQSASAYLLGRLAKHLGERGIVDMEDLLGEARTEMSRRFEVGDDHATAARFLVRQLELHQGGGKPRPVSPGGRFRRLARLFGKGHDDGRGYADASDVA